MTAKESTESIKFVKYVDTNLSKQGFHINFKILKLKEVNTHSEGSDILSAAFSKINLTVCTHKSSIDLQLKVIADIFLLSSPKQQLCLSFINMKTNSTDSVDSTESNKSLKHELHSMWYHLCLLGKI